MKCVFCESEEIASRVIFKNELVQVFPTNIPITPGHLLIIPNRCVVTFDELTPHEVSAILELRGKLVPILKKIFGAEGFHFAWNEGRVAGQSVPHFHLHIVPRKTGDEGITEFEPRKFLYRPGSREASPESELQAISELLKKSL